MQFHVAEAPIQIPPGHEIGMTREQLAPRRHNVEIIVETDAMIVVRTHNPIWFKAGEAFAIADVAQLGKGVSLKAVPEAARKSRKSEAA